MQLIITAVPAVIFIWGFITIQAVRRLPLKELRQRARSGQDRASVGLYELAKTGAAGRLVVWAVTTSSLAVFAARAYDSSWWLGALVILVVSALIVTWQPARHSPSWSWALSAVFARFIASGLNLFGSGLSTFNSLISRWQKPQAQATANNLYEKNDLLELLKAQIYQTDNRIAEADLQRAIQALGFSDQTVGQVMTPRSNVQQVKADEAIGPSVMDELHQSGQSRFPVVRSVTKKTKPEIVGTLYIGKLLDHLADQGKVRSLMDSGAYFINHDSSLEQALGAYLKTGSQLLIVVNGREEFVGTLPIEAVLKQALGQIELSDFNDYDNPRAVADL